MTPEEFRALVDSEVGTSDWIRITQAKVDAFADVTADHQFIHVDPEAARATPFGGTIAHGFLTLSLLAPMIVDAVPRLDGSKMGVNYGFDRLRFLAPVPVGSRIRGRFVLDRFDEEVTGQITFTWAVTVEIEGAEKPALAATWITRQYLTG